MARSRRRPPAIVPDPAPPPGPIPRRRDRARLPALLALGVAAGLALHASPAHAELEATATQAGRTMRPGDPAAVVYVLAIKNHIFLLGPTIRITGVTFENRTSGGGTTAQRDAEWGTVRLAWGRRAADVLGATSPTGQPVATFGGGLASFGGLAIDVAPNDSMYLVVRGAPTLVARDLEVLDLRIAGPGAVSTSGGGIDVASGGTWDPAGGFTVDGMSAAQVAVDTVRTAYFPIGAPGQLALSVRVPPNGWASDRLDRLEIVNRGTAAGGSDLPRMDAWIDDGDGKWQPGQEAWLGQPVFTGGSWVLGGLAADIPAPAGARLFVTVDVAEQAAENATVRLALAGGPLGPFGLAMTSANDGPNDREVGNPVEHVISLIDRVVVSPLKLDPGVARPGAADVPLLAFQATNVYANARTLTGLALANATVGPGTTAERDAELERVELRLDADDDDKLGGFAADPVIATAVLSNGRAQFSNFSVPIAPGETRTLFVTGDVSLLHAADGDVLAATVAVREDFAFEQAGTTVSGAFPLGSNGGWTLDGMVAAQLGLAPAPPQTLAPGDGPREALDLLVRRNGYQPDVLESVTLANLGTATPADLADVRLWRDGGDGAFDGGAGDDADLGALAPVAGRWESAPLAAALGSAGARLFVSVTADSTPADSATVRLAVPLAGLAVASGNDGPLDQPVANADALVIANRGLLAGLAFDAAAVTMGQAVTLTMTVRSTVAESLLAVTPSAPVLAGSAQLAPLGGPTPATRSLGPGESGTFTWTLSADSAGTTRATASASATGSPGGAAYQSLDAQSSELRVFARADSLPLWTFDAMPQSVTRGQAGVLPFYLSFQHPDPDGSPVRVTGLRVRLEREDGSDVAPASLLSRAAVIAAGETLLVRSSLETGGALLDLALATPAIVAGPDPVTLALALDVSASTVVPDFRLVLAGEGELFAEDAATGAPVAVRLQDASWPLATGLARVLAGATRLDASAAPMAPVQAGRGQAEVTLATFTLQSPGVTGVTTDVRVGALDLKLADTLGQRVPKPGRIVRRLRLRSGGQTLADRTVAAGLDSVVAMTLSPLLSVPVNTPIAMQVVADLSDTASLGAFRLEIGDSARFDARDPNTGDRVPAVYATTPLHGPAVTVEDRADSVWVRGLPLLPAELGLGARGVAALTLALRHPGGPATAPLRVDTLIVRCTDDAGAGLVPAPYLDRMQVQWNGVVAASVPDPPVAGSTMLAVLPGLEIAPGDSARITLVLDFEPAAPATRFAIEVGAAGLDVSDANLGLAALAVVEDGESFPLRSGVTRLVPPSRVLVADLEDAMPAVLAPDGLEQSAGVVTLTNGAAAGSGPVRVAHLAVRARDAAGPVALGAAVAGVTLAVDGAPFASSAPLTPDSTTALVAFPAELLLDPAAPARLELRFSTRTNPAVKTFALAIEAGDIGVVQPGSALLDVSILPAPGRTFPLASSPATYGAAELVQSWSSFPNPFSPARGGATFTFYLPLASRVTLEIWTARGDKVATLLAGVPRDPGLHQSDVWDGRNGSGALVNHGVYVAELTAEMSDGRTERLRRKVAVLR